MIQLKRFTKTQRITKFQTDKLNKQFYLIFRMKINDLGEKKGRKFYFIDKFQKDLQFQNQQAVSLSVNKQKEQRLFDIYLSAKKKTSNKPYRYSMYEGSGSLSTHKADMVKQAKLVQKKSKMMDQQVQTQAKVYNSERNKAKIKQINNKSLSPIYSKTISIRPISEAKKLNRLKQNSTSNIKHRLSNAQKKNNKEKETTVRRRILSKMRKDEQITTIKEQRNNKRSKIIVDDNEKVNLNSVSKITFQSTNDLEPEHHHDIVQIDKHHHHLQKQNRNIQSDINSQRKTVDNMMLSEKPTEKTYFTQNLMDYSMKQEQNMNRVDKKPSISAKVRQTVSADDKQSILGQMQGGKRIAGTIRDYKVSGLKFNGLQMRSILHSVTQQKSQTGREPQDLQPYSIYPNPNFHSLNHTHYQTILPSNHEPKFPSLNLNHQQLLSSNQYPKPKSQNTQDQIIQFPEVTELKVSSVHNKSSINNNNSITNTHSNHPINNDFNQKGISWITDSFLPKSKILQKVSPQTCTIKKYKNGVYFGQIEQGIKNGYGIIFYFDGRLFQGKFLNDYKQGEGYQEFPDGSKYTGEFKSGTKNGKGVFQWPNGQVYEGQWQNGKKHGSGFWKSLQGQSYIGEWKNGKPEGFGVYVSKQLDRYEGEFQNSQKQGLGTERFNNGQTYVGQYRRNRPNGKGQYFWTNGNYYKGDFANHLRHGQGYFEDAQKGQTYRGEYKNDKKCGFGQLRYGNKLYVGNFQNDYCHGYGQLYEQEQLKCKGFWINDAFLNEQQQSGKQQNILPTFKGTRMFEIKENELQRSRKRNNDSVKARINNINRTEKLRTILDKSKSPTNKSIESLQDSRQKSFHRRACGCSRKH